MEQNNSDILHLIKGSDEIAQKLGYKNLNSMSSSLWKMSQDKILKEKYLELVVMLYTSKKVKYYNVLTINKFIKERKEVLSVLKNIQSLIENRKDITLHSISKEIAKRTKNKHWSKITYMIQSDSVTYINIEDRKEIVNAFKTI